MWDEHLRGFRLLVAQRRINFLQFCLTTIHSIIAEAASSAKIVQSKLCFWYKGVWSGEWWGPAEQQVDFRKTKRRTALQLRGEAIVNPSEFKGGSDWVVAQRGSPPLKMHIILRMPGSTPSSTPRRWWHKQACSVVKLPDGVFLMWLQINYYLFKCTTSTLMQHANCKVTSKQSTQINRVIDRPDIGVSDISDSVQVIFTHMLSKKETK